MHGKPQRLKVRAVFNSKKVKVRMRRPPQPGNVKIISTLKKVFFRDGDNFDNGGGDENFEEQLQKLLTRLSNMNLSKLVEEWFRA